MRSSASTGTQEIKLKNSPRSKWHLIYYLLAAFNVLTVLTGLYLNHRIMAIYTRDVCSWSISIVLEPVARLVGYLVRP